MAQDSLNGQPDSLAIRDTLQRDTAVAKDTIPRIIVRTRTWKEDTLFFNSFLGPLMPQKGTKAQLQIAAERPFRSKDELFYLLLGVLALFALIRYIFPKYISDLFRLFFQSSFRQKQTKEQLVQGTLPSLFMNILFFIVAGLFITVALDQMELLPFSFWKTFLYTSLCIMVIYGVKFIFLLFAGWVFNVRSSASTYAFIVFLINKIIGMLLLPLLFLLAYAAPAFANVLLTVSICLVAILFVYRYIAALTSIRSDLRVNALHFFIYLCAVEIVPLLIIYKVLADRIGAST